jgi:hypothetical protein
MGYSETLGKAKQFERMQNSQNERNAIDAEKLNQFIADMQMREKESQTRELAKAAYSQGANDVANVLRPSQTYGEMGFAEYTTRNR